MKKTKPAPKDTRLYFKSRQQKLGKKECTYGPSYWCASPENARKCQVNRSSHCMIDWKFDADDIQGKELFFNGRVLGFFFRQRNTAEPRCGIATNTTVSPHNTLREEIIILIKPFPVESSLRMMWYVFVITFFCLFFNFSVMWKYMYVVWYCMSLSF